MWVVEDLLRVLHRTDRQTHRQQCRRRTLLSLVAEPVVDDLPEPAKHVLGALGSGVRALVADQVQPLDGLTELRPIALGGDDDADPSVLALERSPRRHEWLTASLQNLIGQ